MVGWPVIRRPTVPTHAALDSVAVPVPATAIDQRRVLVTRPPFFHRVRTCARRWQLSRSFPRTKLEKRIAAYRCKSLRILSFCDPFGHRAQRMGDRSLYMRAVSNSVAQGITQAPAAGQAIRMYTVNTDGLRLGRGERGAHCPSRHHA